MQREEAREFGDVPHGMLRLYLERHNVGRQAGDFRPLLDLMAEYCEMWFERIPIGPFLGKPAIAGAFEKNPPSDDLVPGKVLATRPDFVQAEYAWRAQPTKTSGTIELTVRDGKISKIVVS